MPSVSGLAGWLALFWSSITGNQAFPDPYGKRRGPGWCGVACLERASRRPAPLRARGAGKVKTIGKLAPEEFVRHRGRIGEIVARRLDAVFKPRHQVEEGGAELRRVEVAVNDTADRALHQQIALLDLAA